MRLALASAIGGMWGCAGPQRPPPPSRVALAGAPVVWRDWSSRGAQTICEAEPHFLIDELTLVNSALQRFLNATASQDPRDWPEGKIVEILSERETIELVRVAHAKNLELLRRCDFAGRAGFPFIRERGRELISSSRERDAQVDQMAQRARTQRMLAAWRDSLREQREYRRSSCPARARAPVVFFAWRDEAQVSHWEFCDGSETTQALGGEMKVDRSVRALGLSKPFDPARYASTAREWPESQINVAPR